MKISKIKGTNDFFNYDIIKYRFIERKAREIWHAFGFKEIMTPIIEYTEVFSRGVGEETDIVNKEMYTFNDRSNRSITLRPEGTAAVSRAYVENKLYIDNSLTKLAYFGPMFRYERPQAGRYRQFTQFGVEMIGKSSPLLDADMINFIYQFLQSIGIMNIKAVINTIGSKNSREQYEKVLISYFSDHIDEMCEDCQKRLIKNPLRILDCKVDHEKTIMKNAPKITDYLDETDRVYHQEVKDMLVKLNIPFEEDPKLVRGLDYYCNTVFEFIYTQPDSKIDGMTLLGGGRYNSLVSEFDGPATEAIGFACGIERLMLVLDELNIEVKETDIKPTIVVITIGENNKPYGLLLANELRKTGLLVDIDYVSHNLKPQFKLAEKVDASYVLILGDDEVKQNNVKIKNQITKEEIVISQKDINKFFTLGGRA